MKKCALSFFASLALLMAACSQNGQVDTGALEDSFAEAPAEQQSLADKAAAAIKSADYQQALTELQTLANESLTDAQKQAVKDTIAQVQEVLKAKAQEAVDSAKDTAKDTANKAVDDLSKGLKLD